jgi:hypothetical protein
MRLRRTAALYRRTRCCGTLAAMAHSSANTSSLYSDQPGGNGARRRFSPGVSKVSQPLAHWGPSSTRILRRRGGSPLEGAGLAAFRTNGGSGSTGATAQACQVRPFKS